MTTGSGLGASRLPQDLGSGQREHGHPTILGVARRLQNREKMLIKLCQPRPAFPSISAQCLKNCRPARKTLTPLPQTASCLLHAANCLLSAAPSRPRTSPILYVPSPQSHLFS